MSSHDSPPHFNPETLTLVGGTSVGSSVGAGLYDLSDSLRRVVTLGDLEGRNAVEQEKFGEANFPPVDEDIWLAETVELQAHAARVAGLKDVADALPRVDTLPVLRKLDPNIAKLVLSRIENPLMKMPLDKLPSSVKLAPLDPLVAEALIVTSQMRVVLDHLETALVRHDYSCAEDAGLGIAMRTAGIVQLVKEGEKSRDMLDEHLTAREDRFGSIACNRPVYNNNNRHALQ